MPIVEPTRQKVQESRLAPVALAPVGRNRTHPPLPPVIEASHQAAGAKLIGPSSHDLVQYRHGCDLVLHFNPVRACACDCCPCKRHSEPVAIVGVVGASIAWIVLLHIATVDRAHKCRRGAAWRRGRSTTRGQREGYDTEKCQRPVTLVDLSMHDWGSYPRAWGMSSISRLGPARLAA